METNLIANLEKNKPLIKVCGLCWSDNLQVLLTEVKPDFVGFNFYKKSLRYCLETDEWWNVPKIGELRIGVYVDHTIEYIVNTCKKYNLDGVQLHGSESKKFCTELRERLLEINDKSIVIKTISIGAVSDSNGIKEVLELCSKYEYSCDYLLFDTACKTKGGSGIQFDWNILNQLNLKIPYLIAGGIGENIEQQLEVLNNFNYSGLDINSKVEVKPGLKDVDKVLFVSKKIRKI